jgi:hypothetical protein
VSTSASESVVDENRRYRKFRFASPLSGPMSVMIP